MTDVLTTFLKFPLPWVAVTLLVTRFWPRSGPLGGVLGMLGGVALTTIAFGAPEPTNILTGVLVWPLLGAFVALFLPRQWVDGLRTFTSAWLWAGFVLSLWLLAPVVRSALADGGPVAHFTWALLGRFFGGFATAADYSTGAYQFVESTPWIEAFGISYKVGIDGISLWLVLLTTLLTPLALDVSWNSVSTKVKEFAFSFLLLEVGMIGAFLALDLFLFYVFWELMLVPMYLIIGIWGGKERIYAAVKFFIYTMVGSLLMLVAIVYVVWQYADAPGSPGVTFDLEQLGYLVLPHREQMVLFVAFGLAFAIKVPMIPFHTWLPDAHVQAPTGGSVILAAVLLKLGGYGFIRFAMPLFPWASHTLAPTLAGVAVAAILYGAYCAWVQRDIKKLVAYSSVSHLGFVMLGIFSMTRGGVEGAILQMVSHGISTGALFILVGVIYDRRHTRDLADFGGLAKVMPAYTTVFVIVAMSSVGLPGTNGFVGEFMVMSGAFVSPSLDRYGGVQAVFAAMGVILAAVYMLHAVLKTFWGPLDKKANENLPDLSSRERWILAPLVLLVFWIGLVPGFFLTPMQASVDRFITTWDERFRVSRTDGDARILPEGLRRFAPPPAAPEGQPDEDEPAEAEAAHAPAGGEGPRAERALPEGERLAFYPAARAAREGIDR
ncbi:MAG TPA: NADH-quinone oxidoreductase subunit M [Sandaracinaceae bacterium]